MPSRSSHRIVTTGQPCATWMSKKSGHTDVPHVCVSDRGNHHPILGRSLSTDDVDAGWSGVQYTNATEHIARSIPNVCIRSMLELRTHAPGSCSKCAIARIPGPVRTIDEHPHPHATATFTIAPARMNTQSLTMRLFMAL